MPKTDRRIDASIATSAPFAPSHRRESIEWMAEGKDRRWKDRKKEGGSGRAAACPINSH